MCGICGILNLALEPLRSRAAIDSMSACLVHRGPDSQGKFELPYLALAIRRLSIIDLQTGDQPLINETGDVTVIFNGEIYNYRELARLLAERGHHFRTHSDGEVIAHLYEDHGPAFVEQLNGMFAIALWDEKRQRLILARDRAGEKPLYYWTGNHILVFGSEIKSLLQYPEISRTLDEQALREYLFFGYVPGPRSIFAGIRKLPAGHRMVAEGGEITIEPFWQLRDHLRPPGRPRLTRAQEMDLVDELRLRLREAALSRLVSDVPLGVFLSGGMDSSVIVALMSEIAPGQVKTFSVTFPEKSFSEEPYSNLVARRFQTEHHLLKVDESSLREGLNAVACDLDEPLADPAVVPTYLISRLARPRIKVALSGEGADELFGGYPTYLGINLARSYLRLPAAIRRQLCRNAGALLPVSSDAVPLGLFLRRFMAYAERKSSARHQIWFGMFSPEQLDEIFPASAPRQTAVSDRVLEPVSRAIQGAHFESELAEALYLDFCLYLADDLLVKVDRASMACSLELRTPFLDHRLIEFAARLPASLRVHGFQLKYLLKKAVEPWLPRRVVYRQKRGFSVPTASWMRSSLGADLDELLSKDRLRKQGLFDSRLVGRLVEEHRQGRADHRKPLWTLLCFQLWYEHWGKA